ncbi:hypothetical protein RB597_004076 [Gaeumannomyces tritici]
MTSTGNARHDFILTPQQQSLLFAALNSSRAANSPTTGGNAQSFSPSSFTRSPVDAGDTLSINDSPFVDYDYSFDAGDTSFDDSLYDNTTGDLKMIGDLPVAGTAPESTTGGSEGTDSPEKRSHPDDEDDIQENGAKRRGSTEKVPKKPGRKPLTSEPTSKRKAQNRAAQRAFRERKEKHVKDLELKVEELEALSKTTSTENTNLRAEVDRLNLELQQYKKRLSLSGGARPQPATASRTTFGNPMVHNINDVNFQFEFPRFGSLPGPPAGNDAGVATGRSPSFSQTPSLTNTPSKQGSPNDGYRDNAPANTSKDDLSGIFSPPLTNTNVANASRGSVDSNFGAGGAASSSSPSASSTSHQGPNSSCGTSPEPYTQSPMGFKPVDTLTTIGEESVAGISGSQDFGQFSSISMNDIDWLAQANNFQFDPQLFGGYREPQDHILGTNGTLGDHFFNEAWDVDFTTPFNVPMSPVVPKKDLIAEIDAAKEADDPTEAKGELLTCNKIWYVVMTPVFLSLDQATRLLIRTITAMQGATAKLPQGAEWRLRPRRSLLRAAEEGKVLRSWRRRRPARFQACHDEVPRQEGRRRSRMRHQRAFVETRRNIDNLGQVKLASRCEDWNGSHTVLHHS